jgi:hypothetical protein
MLRDLGIANISSHEEKEDYIGLGVVYFLYPNVLPRLSFCMKSVQG